MGFLVREDVASGAFVMVSKCFPLRELCISSVGRVEAVNLCGAIRTPERDKLTDRIAAGWGGPSACLESTRKRIVSG